MTANPAGTYQGVPYFVDEGMKEPSEPRFNTVLILDTETTGLEPEEGAQLCEIGAILYSVEHQAVLAQMSFLLSVDDNPVEHVNKIPPEITDLSNDLQHSASFMLLDMAEMADAYVCHNVEFDRKWLEGKILPKTDKPWLCTMTGMTWGELKSRPSVATLALVHGVPVWAQHRALTDCIYLAQVFDRRNDLKELLEEAALPRFKYRALVSYGDRQKAKDAGFAWDGKIWHRLMTEQQASQLPFPVRICE